MKAAFASYSASECFGARLLGCPESRCGFVVFYKGYFGIAQESFKPLIAEAIHKAFHPIGFDEVDPDHCSAIRCS